MHKSKIPKKLSEIDIWGKSLGSMGGVGRVGGVGGVRLELLTSCTNA